MTTMTLEEAVRTRHSVRSFTEAPLSTAERAELERVVAEGNKEGGLHMQLVCDEPEAFDSAMAHYGKFTGVRNYVILAGTAAPDLDERCGYYGERVALAAQQLGLGTCWVALTFKKRHVKKMLAAGDKLVVVLALGHGATAGVSHKVKEAGQVSTAAAGAPAWFGRGVELALLAPTAMNQQKFALELTGEKRGGTAVVSAASTGGMYSKVDLGIVKLHFEIGAGTENFCWK